MGMYVPGWWPLAPLLPAADASDSVVVVELVSENMLRSERKNKYDNTNGTYKSRSILKCLYMGLIRAVDDDY